MRFNYRLNFVGWISSQHPSIVHAQCLLLRGLSQFLAGLLEQSIVGKLLEYWDDYSPKIESCRIESKAS